MSEQERRGRPRTTQESRATTLIQLVLHDPGTAAVELAKDLRSGGDVHITLALLDAAATLAKLRGIDITGRVTTVRRHLKAAGFDA